MDSSSSPRLTLVDSHVHFYGCFDTERFFSSAFANFAAAAGRRGIPGATGALLLAETFGERWFEEVADRADREESVPAGALRYTRTGEEESVAVRGGLGKALYVIAGSQIVTEEKLEVLALCTAREFSDGKPIEMVLDEVRDAGGLPVLPWGAGKWLGGRGRIVSKLLRARKGRRLWCADSGVRPLLWPRPTQFHVAEDSGAAVLRGSDPLPLPSEERRAGSFGFALPIPLSEQTPAGDLRRYLSDSSATADPYGRLANPLRFLISQLRLRSGSCRGKRAAG